MSSLDAVGQAPKFCHGLDRSPDVLRALVDRRDDEPTPIQQRTIGPPLAGQGMIAQVRSRCCARGHSIGGDSRALGGDVVQSKLNVTVPEAAPREHPGGAREA